MQELSNWLYQHSLIGVSVGVATAAVVGLLYLLTRCAVTNASRMATKVLFVALTIGGAIGFFLMKSVLLVSALCGVTGVASVFAFAEQIRLQKKY